MMAEAAAAVVTGSFIILLHVKSVPTFGLISIVVHSQRRIYSRLDQQIESQSSLFTTSYTFHFYHKIASKQLVNLANRKIQFLRQVYDHVSASAYNSTFLKLVIWATWCSEISDIPKMFVNQFVKFDFSLCGQQFILCNNTYIPCISVQYNSPF